jgi:SSS family solute:Na+ symporter
MTGWTTLDTLVVVGYFLIVAWIGRVASRARVEGTKDYFLGGRNVPWWAAALSIIATETSAVTYIGVPADAYRGDWSALLTVTGFVIGRFFLAFVFVQVLWGGGHLTVYGYLADRFGDSTRVGCAGLFLVGRIIASAVRVFAGCLAVSAVTGIDVPTAIVSVVVFGSILTYAGGVRAVVWTDVFLGFTLVAGGLCAAAFVVSELPAGLESILSAPDLATKTAILPRAADGSITLFGSWANAKSVLAGLSFGVVLTLATHGTDQDIAQRILTCRSSGGGKLSVLASAVMILPLFALFLGLGTLLYYYHAFGASEHPAPDDTNQVFAVYIARGLPAGVSGFVLAGLLAAAISSYTSTLSALASTAIGDFYAPLVPGRSELHYLRSGKLASAVLAVLLLVASLAFQGTSDNIFKLSLKVFTYVYGAILGVFLLGILTRRGNDRSAVLGMVVSVPVVLALQVREFIAEPRLAPTLVRDAIEGLESSTRTRILGLLPELASPYWISLGVIVCVAIGAIGKPPAAGSSPRPPPSPDS